MSESNDRLISDLNSAASNLKKSIGGKAGEGAEKLYGQAYQALVKAGLRPQLKGKYR
jgi:hypothetical protein